MRMLVLEDLSKAYRTRIHKVKALDGVSLKIDKGEFVVVCGPSGSGKTTLLMMTAAMLHPSRGSVRFDGKDIYKMSGPERARFRANNIGFVFQMFHLVPYLTVLENVMVGRHIKSVYSLLSAFADFPNKRRKEREILRTAGEFLEFVGLSEKAYYRAQELSYGEQRRLEVARALATEPLLLLLDEPTVGLDPDVAHRIREAIQRLHREKGTTILMTTHNMKEAEALCEQVAFINEQLEKGWKDNKIYPSERCTDYEFIRRATLDIVGRDVNVKATGTLALVVEFHALNFIVEGSKTTTSAAAAGVRRIEAQRRAEPGFHQ